MSNLTSTVLFDVVRGWPNGGAIEESYPPETGRTITEGRLCELEADGQVDWATTAVATEGGTAPIQYRMCIQGNDQSDANFVGKVTTLRGDFTVETEKVVGTFTVGNYVTVSVAADTEGYIVERAGTEQILGQVEAWDGTAGKLTVALSL